VIATRAVLIAGVAAWLPGTAAADGTPPGATPAAPPTAPEQPSALDDAAQYPASDRGAAFENALTVPQGQAEVDVRAMAGGLAVLDLRFGATSTTELSAEVGGVAGDGFVPEIAVGIKQVLVRGRRFRFAVDASLRNVFSGGVYAEPAAGPNGCCSGGAQNTSVQVATLGAVVTGCLDRDCVLRLSLGGQIWGAFGDGGGGGTVEVAWIDAELGSPHFRFATEAILGFSGGGDGPAQIVTVGLRGGGRHLAAEGGAALIGDVPGVPVPYFGITARL
jgi:hypothetical protein